MKYNIEGLYQPERGIIRTHTGKYLEVARPDGEDICIEDIAHGLSLHTRWGGQCPLFFSVAEHSIVMSIEAEKHGATPLQCLAVLLHDASEAYLGDMPKPIKDLLPDYQKLERGLTAAITQAFQLPTDPATARLVVDLDREALEDEWTKFFSEHGQHHTAPLPPATAEELFLRRYRQLSGVPRVPSVAELHAGMNC
jgi:hypothetical protein